MKTLHKCIGGGKKLVSTLLFSSLLLVMIMAGCQMNAASGGGNGGQSGSATFFRVTYNQNEANANGKTITGSVPVDGNRYAEGDRAEVLAFGGLKGDNADPVAWVDSDGVEYAPGSHITVNKNITLYAKWAAASFDTPVSFRISDFIAESTKRTGVVFTAAPTGGESSAVATVEWDSANADILKITPKTAGTIDLTANIRIPYIADDGTQSGEAKTAGRGEAMPGYKIKITVEASAVVTVKSDKFLTQRIYFPDFLARSMRAAWGVGPSNNKNWFDSFESGDTSTFTFQSGGSGNWGGHPSIKTLKQGTAKLKAKPGAAGTTDASYDVTVVVDENGWITWTNPPFPEKTKTVTAAELPGVTSITKVSSDNPDITATLNNGDIKLSATTAGGARISVNDGAITFKATATVTGITTVIPSADTQRKFADFKAQSKSKFGQKDFLAPSAENPMLLVTSYATTTYAGKPSDTIWATNVSELRKPEYFEGYVNPPAMWNDLLPDSLKEHSILLLHANNIAGMKSNGNGNKEQSKKWYKEMISYCDELNIPVAIVVVSAGTSYYPFSDISPANADDRAWLDDLVANHPSLKGFVCTENHWSGNYGYVANVNALWLEYAAQNNLLHFIFDHFDGNMDYFGLSQNFVKAVGKYGKTNLVMGFKTTRIDGFIRYSSWSTGMWLSGLNVAAGGLHDTWTWKGTRNYNDLMEGGQGAGGHQQARAIMYPEAMMAINMMNMYLSGQSVFTFEAPWVVYGMSGPNKTGKPAAMIKDVIAPMFEYMKQNKMPTKAQVLEMSKNIIGTGTGNGFWPDMLVSDKSKGWNNTENSEVYKTGRYGVVPLLPSQLVSMADSSVASKLTANKPDWDTTFPNITEPLGSGENEGFAAKLTYDGTNRWFFYNNIVNATSDTTDRQYAKVDLGNGKYLKVEMTPHTAIIAEKDGNSVKVWLTNYRIDKSAVWNGTAYTEGNGDNKAVADTRDAWLYTNLCENPPVSKWQRNTVLTIEGASSVNVSNTAAQANNPGQTPTVSGNTVTMRGNGWNSFTINYN